MTARVSFAWTPDRVEQLRVLAQADLSASRIAQDIGCTDRIVYKKANALKIQLRGRSGAERVRHLRHPFIEGNIAKIPLTRGLFAVIDIADIPLVSGRNWFASEHGKGRFYAGTCPFMGSPQIHLHRFLTNTPMELCVDHKDGDPLNNCRDNLRVCTYQQNSWNAAVSKSNTTGKTGVKRRARNSWNAFINFKGRSIQLGTFRNFEDAVAARIAGEKKYFGEFARTDLGQLFLDGMA